VDQAKFIDLLRQSADLGDSSAQYHLGNFHLIGDMGLEQNEEEAIKHWKKAAEGGNLMAGHNIGSFENNTNGDYVASMRHWRLSASGGYKLSMDCLIDDFEDGFLRHGDLADTLKAFYRARAEMRSEDRDKYIEYLKKTGEYKEEYEC
jgi:TPR repeat protein